MAGGISDRVGEAVVGTPSPTPQSSKPPGGRSASLAFGNGGGDSLPTGSPEGGATAASTAWSASHLQPELPSLSKKRRGPRRGLGHRRTRSPQGGTAVRGRRINPSGLSTLPAKPTAPGSRATMTNPHPKRPGSGTKAPAQDGKPRKLIPETAASPSSITFDAQRLLARNNPPGNEKCPAKKILTQRHCMACSEILKIPHGPRCHPMPWPQIGRWEPRFPRI